MITKIWSRIAGWLGLLGGLAITTLALLQVGRRQGRAQAEQKQERRATADKEKAREVDAKFAGMDDDAVRERARQRLRDRAKK